MCAYRQAGGKLTEKKNRDEGEKGLVVVVGQTDRDRERWFSLL